MCGIAGSINYSNSEFAKKQLHHRGPDSSGVWKHNNIELVHLRLAILDLTEGGHQPMHYSKYTISFNGEIYNYLEIQKELILLGYTFSSTSDTEVILKSIDAWGLENSLAKFNGMWAFALHNQETNKLILCRDRIGKNQFYYYIKGSTFFFASELKAFPAFCTEQKNYTAMIQFVANGYVPGSHSYYANINKVEPGTFLEIDTQTLHLKKETYWHIPVPTIQQIGFEEAVNTTEKYLQQAIQYRLIADVEVGSFLSGGIDSSLVSVLAQKNSSKKIKTFSIGSNIKEYDESIHAKKIANYIGSEHFEYKFTANDLLNLLEDNKYYYDEPFGDNSSLPTMLLSQIAKKEVTVALSGDGGDEMFLGYDRYFFTEKYYHTFNKIPTFLRPLASKILKYSGNDKAIKMAYPLNNVSEENVLSNMYFAVKPWEIENIFTAHFLQEHFKKTNDIFYDLLDLEKNNFSKLDTINKVNQIDLYRNLPDDMLTKVDRASMRSSLEVRCPLLDVQIMQYALALSKETKLQYGPKSILKAILNKHIPEELTKRPKMGFDIPVKHWLKNELYDITFEKINSLEDNIFNKKTTAKNVGRA